MTTETEGYTEWLEHLTNEVKKAIHGMSAGELEWTPLEDDTNSPCVIATHIAGTVAYHIHQLVGGIDVGRDRDAEFAAHGVTAAELESLLDRTAETTRRVLLAASTDDLDSTVERAGQPPVTRRWAILHTLEHVGEHLGHLNLTQQLYATREG